MSRFCCWTTAGCAMRMVAKGLVSCAGCVLATVLQCSPRAEPSDTVVVPCRLAGIGAGVGLAMSIATGYLLRWVLRLDCAARPLV